MTAQPTVDLQLILPEVILSATILIVLVVDLFLSDRRRWLAMPLALVGVVASLVSVVALIGTDASTLSGAFVVDGFSILFKAFFLIVAIAVLFLSSRYFQDGRFYQGEYYFLLLTAFLGCIMMPSVRDLLMLFIAIELVSAPGFLMAAFRKSDPRSNEGGLKFFLIGVISSTVMLYGMSLIYGLTGTLNLPEIATKLAGPIGQTPLVLAGILFVVVGFAFKVSAVPFHFWAPDTYEGAPVPVAAFLSVASKAAGFVGLLIMMFVGFINQAEWWAPVFAVLAVATMALGNLVALKQNQVVRLLAYSSVAQAGYMLLPFALVSANPETNATAFAATVTYILLYSIMNLGAFAVVIAVSREAPSGLISDYAGLIKRAPLMAVSMTLFMVSLAGIPPTAGFWAKFAIFFAAIQHGGTYGIVLAAIMVIFSVVSVGYYWKLVKEMDLAEGERRGPLRAPALVGIVAGASAIGVFILGFLPAIITSIPPNATLGQ